LAVIAISPELISATSDGNSPGIMGSVLVLV
jgi:hypothetical protein